MPGRRTSKAEASRATPVQVQAGPQIRPDTTGATRKQTGSCDETARYGSRHPVLHRVVLSAAGGLFRPTLIDKRHSPP